MTNPLTDYWPVFQMYQALRPQLLEVIDDDDLAFSVGGAAPTLGDLCREMGERSQTVELLACLVAALRAWYGALDTELAEVIENMSEEDATNRLVDRGHNFRVPVYIQLDIYKEALLIFCSKAWVYLKVMGKAPPKQWRVWLG